MRTVVRHSLFRLSVSTRIACPLAIRTLIVRLVLALAALVCAAPAHSADLTRAQALTALVHHEPFQRLAGVQRLADIGRFDDGPRLLNVLRDVEEPIREAAEAALWQIWSRSGDAVIDKLYARGIEQMQAQDFEQALATFDAIVRRKPAFAEGWNKRATLRFMLGQHAESLLDCDEVLQRNRHHFGALSGAGQIHLLLGRPQRALEFFQRALEVNPNLQGPAEMVPKLRELVRGQGRHST